MEQGVREDQIITVALDDDVNLAYLHPDALSGYIRSRITKQDEMFCLFIDEVQYAISTYLSFLTDSFLFRCSGRYDVKGKKYFKYPSRYYSTAVGLGNVRLNLRQQEETHIMGNDKFKVNYNVEQALYNVIYPLNRKPHG